MNANTLVPESVTEGVMVMHPSDFKVFFAGLRQIEYETIGTLSIEDLTRVQERVRLLKELEAFLLSIRQQQTRKPQ